MSRALQRGCAALVLLSVACRYLGGDYLEQTVRLSGAGTSSFALHVAVIGTYASAGGSYRGTLVNRSSDVDCVAAFYRFRDPPQQADMPILQAGQVAPAELPGGGVRMAYHALPRTGDRRFVVPVGWIQIGDGEEGDPTLDEWVVGLLCPDADVAVDLEVSVSVESQGEEDPTLEPTWLERVW